jgi:hypothetical protein
MYDPTLQVTCVMLAILFHLSKPHCGGGDDNDSAL